MLRTWRVPSLACLIGAGVALPLTFGSVTGQVIRGTVRDTTTGDPITGVRITISELMGRPVRTAVTRPDGTFTVRDLASGTYLLVLRQVGYRPLVTPPVDVTTVDTLGVDYFLLRLPVELDPITVEAEAVARFRELQFLTEQGFFERARRTRGRFLDPAAIDARRETTRRADWFLSGTVFMTPVPGSQRGFQLRCGRPRLFLDGREFYGDDFDQAIGPAQVLAIEIYDVRSGIVDILYGRCAVVVWTKAAAGG